MGAIARLLLVAKSGPLADGLLGFLAAIPEVQVIGHLDRCPASTATVADLHPSVVVLAFGRLAEQDLAAVRRLRAALPESRCVVLAQDVQQQRVAQTAGADAVLINGCRPGELVAAIRPSVGVPTESALAGESQPPEGNGRSQLLRGDSS